MCFQETIIDNQVMSKILIIGYVWPEPDSSAAGSRMMQLIEFFLAQNWRVTYASAAAESEHRFAFESLGVIKKNIQVNNPDFDTFVENLMPDIVLFDRYIMEEQFGWRVEKYCPNAIRIIETVDLHCLREARHLAHKQQRSLTEDTLYKELAQSDIAMREIASILRCDLSLMISNYEMELLLKRFNLDPSLLLYLPFMLDNIHTSNIKKLPDYSQRQHFVSIGNFRHAPNWDAVLYLKETLWPLIHKKLPHAQMHIYGAYPPPKATRLHKPKQNFYISGWAESAEQVIKDARICLAPLRFGAGMKGKLLNAMQFGTPSITTTIGAESMHDNLPWNGVITNEPAAFAEAAVELYNNESKWKTAQENGFKLINTIYDKKTLSEKLLSKIITLQANLKAHRLNNFTGAMLRHHTMKSTQYMAQWIEAKNKLR